MKHVKLGALVLIMVAGLMGHALADVLIIANRGVSVASVSKSDLERIYRGQLSRWEDGSRVNFAILRGDVMDSFLSEYVRMSPAQFDQHWKRQVFTGRGQMPPTMNRPADMVTYVANTQGAIGFVPEGTRIDEVKVLGITP
ncbi:hypothetical protein LZ24_00952 [Desulfobotulus alkaliphilus]|uniref:PBP domain-containing protein n=1 Tax=Desulfobotulus alkaliphilus TaxID=622671 RepID=A0A562RYY4_9BACT|nr:hypothetical protein [Desulfobotulus alkaliphilus]TWI74349.1 hypothetical protein LZ24_00952 [Desulfobotulus alkaliphilus]